MEPLKTALLCAYMECTEQELNEFIGTATAGISDELKKAIHILKLISDCENAHLEPTLANLEYMLNFNKHLKKS